MKSFISFVLALVVALAASNQARAALTLNNIQHFSDAGGVWNNTNPGNWAIWVSPDDAPNDPNPRPFLNEPNPLNNPIPLPYGTHTYTLFKNNYASIDQSTIFTFQEGTSIGNIVINRNAAYLGMSDPLPLTPGASLYLGGTQINITSFGWYDEAAFNQDFVGTNQNLGAGGGLDHVAVLVITAIVVPEPATASLGLLAFTGLALRRHRRA